VLITRKLSLQNAALMPWPYTSAFNAAVVQRASVLCVQVLHVFLATSEA